jgi:single-stranded-DNA-specific exonuclease
MILKTHYIEKMNEPLLAEICYANQLDDDQLDQLLNPILIEPSSHPLFLQATQRILNALEAKEKIMVCGDYDADGVCSTSILVKTLRDLGAHVGYYIPHRFEEGYGLSPKTVDLALKKGYSLFLIVDNGVSAFEALAKLNEAKIDSIILDHHEITEEVPCTILIHPRYLESDYKNSCGSALAYMLSTHLKQNDYLCTLAAIATIADVMDVWGYNRTLVKQGLALLNLNNYPSIQSLNDKTDPLDELGVAFQIIPKINAIGRMNDELSVNALVEYFCSEDRFQILLKAQQIKAINEKRKTVNTSMMAKTKSALVDPHAVIIIDDPDFHEGIVGITAGQLVRKTNKPVIVLAHKDGSYKGSIRAPLGTDLRELLKECMVYTMRYGGHALAAGIEIAEDQYDAFRLSVYASTDHLEPSSTERFTLLFDPQLINLESYTRLMDFKPFGQGFELPEVEIEDGLVISSGGLKNGYKWQIDVKGSLIDVLCFNNCDETQFDRKVLHLSGRLGLNTFRGKTGFSIVAESWL